MDQTERTAYRMTDKDYRAQFKRWDKIRNYWDSRLVFPGWRINMLVGRGFCPTELEDRFSCQTVAVTVAQYEYATADVYFFASMFSKLDDDRLEFIFLHEMGHVLLKMLQAPKPTREQMLREEKCATDFANLMLGVKAANAAEIERTRKKAAKVAVVL